jgi:hypothetical protein
MNQRIDKLIEQCTVQNFSDCIGGYETFDHEKFAELIVRECADVIFNGQFSDDECEGNSHRVSYNNGRFGASRDIKKHFGVEE